MNRETRKKVSLAYKQRLPLLWSLLLCCGILISACKSNSTVQHSDTNITANNQVQINLNLDNIVSHSSHESLRGNLDEYHQLLEQMSSASLPQDQYAQKMADYQGKASRTIDGQTYLQLKLDIAQDLTAMNVALAKGSAQTLMNRLFQHAESWGNAHKWHNPYDQKDYILNTGYWHDSGSGWWLANDLNSKGNAAVFTDAENVFFNQYMLEINYGDNTAYNAMHIVDQTLIDHYQANHGQTIIVSTTEQAMRIYQDGKLTHDSMLVTMGREQRPSLPGYWRTYDRAQNLWFSSSDPPDSPDWYSPRVVDYVLMYHSEGFYFHSAKWRKDYGPYTQFPHHDSGGDAEATVGSHGCINLPPEKMKWLYEHTTNDTRVIIF